MAGEGEAGIRNTTHEIMSECYQWQLHPFEAQGFLLRAPGSPLSTMALTH